MKYSKSIPKAAAESINAKSEKLMVLRVTPKALRKYIQKAKTRIVSVVGEKTPVVSRKYYKMHQITRELFAGFPLETLIGFTALPTTGRAEY